MKRLFYRLSTILTLMACAAVLPSCTAIMDDEPEPCPQGLEIRFVYDYNLDRANAFHSQVDCVTLHIYDSEGRFVRTQTETSSVLADENYRMKVEDLPEGTYRLIAYGGATCDKASITHTAVPAEGSLDTEVGMRLDPECLEPGNPKGRLHDHFYGSMYAEVKIAPTLSLITLKMMKNTNHFRILLQHLNYEPLDGNDYDFEITDDNTLFDHANRLVDNGTVTYTPWSQGSVSTGLAEPEEVRQPSSRAITEVQMACAELSTSRLMTHRSPKLKVTHRPSGQTIIDIPLNNYLLALRGDHFDWTGEQEFLDRKSDWQLFFFMDNDRHWHSAYIKVDDWVVRVNDISA